MPEPAENIVLVSKNYSICSQGVVLTFSLNVDYGEIDTITEVSSMFLEFVYDKFMDLFRDYEFASKYETPVVVGNDKDLILYLCFTAEKSDELIKELNKLGIKEENYV